MSLTTRVLIGLVLGLAIGLALASFASPGATAAAIAVVEPLGTLFINAIRMTVIPLVVASLVAAVATMPSARDVGRTGGRALLIFVVLLAIAAAFTAVVAPMIFSWLPLDPATAESFRRSAAAATGEAADRVARIPTIGGWIVDLVPANPIKAAADGAMLPLIVFAVAFGLALGRVDAERRLTTVRVFEGIAEASLVLVRWILVAAPIGVFALALPLAARLGVGAAGALAFYVGAVAILVVLFMAVVLYPAAVIFGGVSLREFARASAPAQAVAFSARSSLASLPAMMEGARDRLRLPDEIVSFLLPLAASTFRVGAGIGVTAGVAFVARLYGVELSAATLATVVVTVVATSFSIPGIPAGSIIMMVPVLLAAGLPPEGMGLLIAIDTIPDMFRTTANVTGDMTAAAILGRRPAGASASERAAA